MATSSVAAAAHHGTAFGCDPMAPPACGASVEVAVPRAAAAALASVAAGAKGWTGPQRQGVLVELNLTIAPLAAIRSSGLIVERDAET